MQSVSAWTTVTIVVMVDVGSALGISMTRSRCPGVSLALGDSGHIVRAIMDGEMQGIGACASVTIVVVVDLGSSLGLGLTRSRRPGVCLAFSDGGHIVRAIMDCQMQGVRAGTAVFVIVIVGICT